MTRYLQQCLLQCLEKTYVKINQGEPQLKCSREARRVSSQAGTPGPQHRSQQAEGPLHLRPEADTSLPPAGGRTMSPAWQPLSQ